MNGFQHEARHSSHLTIIFWNYNVGSVRLQSLPGGGLFKSSKYVKMHINFICLHKNVHIYLVFLNYIAGSSAHKCSQFVIIMRGNLFVDLFIMNKLSKQLMTGHVALKK